ncbi:unnamed protein product [Ectocarpus sp. 12 AP-2014]
MVMLVPTQTTKRRATRCTDRKMAWVAASYFRVLDCSAGDQRQFDDDGRGRRGLREDGLCCRRCQAGQHLEGELDVEAPRHVPAQQESLLVVHGNRYSSRAR